MPVGRVGGEPQVGGDRRGACASVEGHVLVEVRVLLDDPFVDIGAEVADVRFPQGDGGVVLP